jgi:WD40 repeat protein
LTIVGIYLVIAVASKSYDVFLSYSRSDSQSAAEIDAYIRANGLTSFFDRRSLTPGLPWVRALEDAIGAAKAVLVLIGPRGLGNTQQVAAAAFNSDCKRIATGSWDHTAHLWDANTGEKLPVTVGHTGHIVFAAAFSPDDERIVTAGGDNTVRVWDAATGTQITALKAHTAKVRSVKMTRDGKRLLTSAEDGTALLRDARWLVTRGADLVQAVCREKLVGHAQILTLEDAALSGLRESNICASAGDR